MHFQEGTVEANYLERPSSLPSGAFPDLFILWARSFGCYREGWRPPRASKIRPPFAPSKEPARLAMEFAPRDPSVNFWKQTASNRG